jgi:selenide,water dikinase
LGAGPLLDVISRLPQATDPKLLVGSNSADDAGVYQISDTQALVVTTDFFPPIVDDPRMFGRIAAANALSDVYAMGARPMVALNILCFPYGKLPLDIMEQILLGGHEKVTEAGAAIAGGHSVKDTELKYGLAVTGIVDMDKIKTNAGAQVGDMLILTKPVGTGIVSTAVKNNAADSELADTIADQMAQLNRQPSEIMHRYRCSAVTDVTGYGLIGHALEGAEASGVSIEVHSREVPVITDAVHLARKGHLTGGGKDNRTFCEDRTSYAADLDEPTIHVLHDPQTSGGLLIAVNPDDAESMLEDIRAVCEYAALIGQVESGDGKIIIS